MISVKFVWLFSFILISVLDYLIKNNYLGTGIKQVYLKFIGFSYFSIVLFLTFIIFLFLMLFQFFGISLICFDTWYFDNDLINFMSDSNTSSGTSTSTSTAPTTNVNADANVTLNNPVVKVSMPASAVNNLAGAASAAAGASAALKAMQHIPGSPGTKAIAGAATMLAVQGVSYGMSKVFNSQSSQSSNTNNTTKKLFNYLESNISNNNNNNLTNLTELYNNFPLNLLPDIDLLITAELMFLSIILNIYVVKFISKIDYNKYIFDNKFGIILKKIINRYIIMWSKSVKFLLIFSWIGLFICVIFSKIFIYYILNP